MGELRGVGIRSNACARRGQSRGRKQDIAEYAPHRTAPPRAPGAATGRQEQPTGGHHRSAEKRAVGFVLLFREADRALAIRLDHLTQEKHDAIL